MNLTTQRDTVTALSLAQHKVDMTALLTFFAIVAFAVVICYVSRQISLSERGRHR